MIFTCKYSTNGVNEYPSEGVFFLFLSEHLVRMPLVVQLLDIDFASDIDCFRNTEGRDEPHQPRAINIGLSADRFYVNSNLVNT